MPTRPLNEKRNPPVDVWPCPDCGRPQRMVRLYVYKGHDARGAYHGAAYRAEERCPCYVPVRGHREKRKTWTERL